MEFEIIRALEFTDVERLFEAEFPDDPNGTAMAKHHSTKRYTAKLLRSPDLGGTWALVRAPAIQLGDVVLPWHLSKEDENKYEVISPAGMLLREVVRELEGRIQIKAPEFVKRVKRLVERPLGHIFLSQVIPRSEPTFSKMIARPGHLVCLDGLHRLIALGRTGLPDREVEIAVAMERQSGSG